MRRELTSGIQRVLELFAGAEPGLLRGLDGDFFTGLRISPFAAGASRHDEHTESRQADFVSRLE